MRNDRPRPAQVHVVPGDRFDATVLSSPVPVLVDFHAEWCAPCKWLDPILDALVQQSEGRFWIAKVDVDEAPELAARYKIGSVPTVILFKEGVEANRSVGVEPERLRAMLQLPS